MCGRYTLTTPLEDLVEVFDVPVPAFEYRPRYNIAPTQEAPVVARDGHGTRMGLLRWGLVPHWAEDPAMGARTINARAETLLRKPSFRQAAERRRCLVLADGFYEWQKRPGGKQPFWIHRPGREPLSFAGLWEKWKRGGDPLYTFTIVTVDSNATVEPIHDRMPAVISEGNRESWLDAGIQGSEAVTLLEPYRGELVTDPVSTLVNSPANDVPECVEPLEGASD